MFELSQVWNCCTTSDRRSVSPTGRRAKPAPAVVARALARIIQVERLERLCYRAVARRAVERFAIGIAARV